MQDFSLFYFQGLHYIFKSVIIILIWDTGCSFYMIETFSRRQRYPGSEASRVPEQADLPNLPRGQELKRG